MGERHAGANSKLANELGPEFYVFLQRKKFIFGGQKLGQSLNQIMLPTARWAGWKDHS
jgi:hypothetical protein